MNFISFPSIEQFNNVIRTVSIKTAYVGKDATGENIYDGSIPKPKLNYRGTVKLHGTNAGISFQPDGTICAQSRNRNISVGNDNNGFAIFVFDQVGAGAFKDLISSIRKDIPEHNDATIVIYGEWCGQSIQSGVAISKLDKSFFIFGIRVYRTEEDSCWLDMTRLSSLPKIPDKRIYNILDFPFYNIEIDFEAPGKIKEQLETLTNQIDKECPVGKAFGLTGPGEGLVWTCGDDKYNSSEFWFKTKGAAHKATTTKEVVPIDIEKANSLNEFAVATISKMRCEQAIAYLKEMKHPLTKQSTPHFLKWMNADILKEEAEMMAASSITAEDVGKAVGTHARVWYFKWLEVNQ